MARGDPTRGDAGDGFRHDGKRVERRRVKYVTREEWQRRNRRVTRAWVVLAVVSTLSGYLGYTAGRETDRNLQQSGADAVFRSCLSRADIRITTADALDDLRAAAIRPMSPPAEVDAFFRRTQGPINELLTVPAGAPVHTVGRLPEAFLDRLRARATLRCAAASKREFGRTPHVAP